jgi:hypothetical protein
MKELYVAAVNNGKIYKITTATLGTQEDNLLTVRISPNPAHDRVFVEGLQTENARIGLIGTEGKIVLEGIKLDSENSFDVTGITPGVYYLNIKTTDLKEYSQKLIIK